MKRILVIGNLAWDRPVRLAQPLASGLRLSGASLGDTTRAGGELLGGYLGGGGGNAGAALARAGRRVAVVAAVAQDSAGEAILNEAARAGIDTSCVVRFPGATPMVLVIVDSEGERTVLTLDEGPPPAPELFTPAFDSARNLGSEGLFVRAALPGAAAFLAAFQGPTLTHWPSGRDLLANSRLLVASADDLDADFKAAPLAAARALGAGSLSAVIVTQGAGPVLIHTDPGVARIMPPPPGKVADATGAGDIFAAGVLDALVCGADLTQAVTHGCRWGADAVALPGAAPIEAPPGAFVPYA